MNTQPPMDEEALIDAALAVLESAPPTRAAAPDEPAGSPSPPPSSPPPPSLSPPSPSSPTLDALAASRRPSASTVCEGCPNSVWFASPTEVKCYCRVMFLVTWSSREPSQITHCDGVFLGQADDAHDA